MTSVLYNTTVYKPEYPIDEHKENKRRSIGVYGEPFQTQIFNPLDTYQVDFQSCLKFVQEVRKPVPPEPLLRVYHDHSRTSLQRLVIQGPKRDRNL